MKTLSFHSTAKSLHSTSVHRLRLPFRLEFHKHLIDWDKMGELGSSLPSLRWGILGTGWISITFAIDLLVPQPDVPFKHLITAIGSSSTAKGNSFVEKLWKDSANQLEIVDTYDGVYDNANVDIVYVGTPHSEHKKNCLRAIAAGKHVLCEKPFTMNKKDALEVFEAAKEKGVFIMEALWTRLFSCSRPSSKSCMSRSQSGRCNDCSSSLATSCPWPACP